MYPNRRFGEDPNLVPLIQFQFRESCLPSAPTSTGLYQFDFSNLYPVWQPVISTIMTNTKDRAPLLVEPHHIIVRDLIDFAFNLSTASGQADNRQVFVFSAVQCENSPVKRRPRLARKRLDNAQRYAPNIGCDLVCVLSQPFINSDSVLIVRFDFSKRESVPDIGGKLTNVVHKRERESPSGGPVIIDAGNSVPKIPHPGMVFCGTGWHFPYTRCRRVLFQGINQIFGATLAICLLVGFRQRLHKLEKFPRESLAINVLVESGQPVKG